MVVVFGVTDGPLEELVNPEGSLVHEYVCVGMGAFPIETEFPAQMVLPLPAYTDGSELTLMVTESDLLQPVAVTVSVRRYTVADAGET